MFYLKWALCIAKHLQESNPQCADYSSCFHYFIPNLNDLSRTACVCNLRLLSFPGLPHTEQLQGQHQVPITLSTCFTWLAAYCRFTPLTHQSQWCHWKDPGPTLPPYFSRSWQTANHKYAVRNLFPEQPSCPPSSCLKNTPPSVQPTATELT